jgi:uncharacterized membrane protein
MAPDHAFVLFLRGALVMGCAVAGLFFVRFYRQTRDRLFGLFAAAFWVLGLNWVVLAFYRVAQESRHYTFVVRLVAFLIILFAIVDKNRERPG